MRAWAICTMVLFDAVALTQGRSQSIRAEITNIVATRVASVSFQIQGGDKEVFIPYCVKDSEGSFEICAYGVATLESFDGQKWSRVKPGYYGEVFGVEDGQLNPVGVPPKTALSFRFDFSPRLYHVHSGSRLRVVVAYWNDAESVKTSGPVGRIASVPFVCP